MIYKQLQSTGHCLIEICTAAYSEQINAVNHFTNKNLKFLITIQRKWYQVEITQDITKTVTKNQYCQILASHSELHTT